MRILIATGGTGGHIFPALQTACELKARGHEVIFAGALAVAQQKIQSAGFTVNIIAAEGLGPRSVTNMMRFSGRMAAAVCQSIGLVRRIKPNKVIGFGGYGSFPVIFAARLLGRPSMIHEQNVVPGKANALMSKMVSRIAISFKDSSKNFPATKIVWTGCPCHGVQSTKSRVDLFHQLGLNPQRKVIVLLGGSQGSHKLNEIFFEFMSSYAHILKCQGIHMTGKMDYPIYAEKYKNAGLPVKAFEFIHNIDEVYAITDVMIARAGAATVSELGVLAIPAVLVPYPFAGNHQKYNAEVLSKAGVACLLEQKDLTVESLKLALESLLGSEYSREAIRIRTQDLFRLDATQQLAMAVESL